MTDLFQTWMEHSPSIQKTIDESPEALFVFDCDQTLINGDIGEAVFRRAINQRWFISHDAFWLHLIEGEFLEKQVNHWRKCYEQESQELTRYTHTLSDELWAAYLELCHRDVFSAYVLAARLSYQRTPVELALFTQETLAADDKVCIRPRMMTFVERLQTIGKVWVVSSSHIDIVRVIAYHYNIPSTQVVGLDFTRIIETSCYSDQLITPAPIGVDKVSAFKQHHQIRPVLMSGDSKHDFPMMNHAHHGLFIDHHRDQELKDQALAISALSISATLL